MHTLTQHALTWLAVAAVALAMSYHGPSETDMVADTAAALHDAIEQARRERPDLWTDEQAARAHHAVALAARGEMQP